MIFKGKKRVSYPENLVALLQALFSSGAIFQNSGYENAHVVPSGQPQPDALPLPELHQLHAWPGEGEEKQPPDFSFLNSLTVDLSAKSAIGPLLSTL